MKSDPRGGYNRHGLNIGFFKTWTPRIAYALGYIYADGSIIDARKSSRTCYLSLTSVDKSILKKIREAMSSNHPLYPRKECKMTIRVKNYFRSNSCTLRVGNKNIYQDLLYKGLSPKKSLIMKFPIIPKKYFEFFLREYLDDDGCINLYFRGCLTAKTLYIQLIFTSGSKLFLDDLSSKLASIFSIKKNNTYRNNHAYRLVYKDRKALLILRYFYRNLKGSPYLERKYCKYLKFLDSKKQVNGNDY